MLYIQPLNAAAPMTIVAYSNDKTQGVGDIVYNQVLLSSHINFVIVQTPAGSSEGLLVLELSQ